MFVIIIDPAVFLVFVHPLRAHAPRFVRYRRERRRVARPLWGQREKEKRNEEEKVEEEGEEGRLMSPCPEAAEGDRKKDSICIWLPGWHGPQGPNAVARVCHSNSLFITLT